MNQLIFGNLIHRPLRSIISALAVAIEVIMILSITAVMLGMLNGNGNLYEIDLCTLRLKSFSCKP